MRANATCGCGKSKLHNTIALMQIFNTSIFESGLYLGDAIRKIRACLSCDQWQHTHGYRRGTCRSLFGVYKVISFIERILCKSSFHNRFSSGTLTAFLQSRTRVLPEIQLRQALQGSGMLTSTATSQRVQPQLSVRNRTMTSAPADHDHNVFARKESRHSVVQTSAQLMAILGLHNSRISTNVCSQALVAVGIIELFVINYLY